GIRLVTAAGRRGLQARIEGSEHRDVARGLGLTELSDTMARERRLQVRLPSRTRATLLRALERGVIDGGEAAERLHVDRLEIQRMRRLRPASERGGDYYGD